MQEIIPTCGVCHQEYNSGTRVARVISFCAHSLCTQCISDILSKNTIFQCPFDKRQFNQPPQSADAFLVNYALQEVVEEELKYEYCAEHIEFKKKIICAQEKQMICGECALYGKHDKKKSFDDSIGSARICIRFIGFPLTYHFSKTKQNDFHKTDVALLKKFSGGEIMPYGSRPPGECNLFW